MKKLLALVMVTAMLLSVSVFTLSASAIMEPVTIYFNDFNEDADWNDNVPLGFMAANAQFMSRLTDGGIDGSGAWRLMSGDTGDYCYANTPIGDARVVGGYTYRFSCDYKIPEDGGRYFFYLQYVEDADLPDAELQFK